jgi:hypothetical protein
MDTNSVKPVREDWRAFNEAVEMRAAYLKGRVVPPAPTPSPRPPADWLRRGLGIGSVVLASGVATALVLWVLSPPRLLAQARLPAAISAVPAPQPPTPGTKVVVDFTKFTTVTVGDLAIVSGWQYNNSEDTRPAYQFCYVDPLKAGTALSRPRIYVADTTAGIRSYDERDMAPLSRADYEAAWPRCTWAPGAALPRPANGVPLPPAIKPRGGGQERSA